MGRLETNKKFLAVVYIAVLKLEGVFSVHEGSVGVVGYHADSLIGWLKARGPEFESQEFQLWVTAYQLLVSLGKGLNPSFPTPSDESINRGLV